MFKSNPTLQREKPKELTPEEKEAMALAEWCWNSHMWDEFREGYEKCVWCGDIRTTEMPLTMEYNRLCPRNPLVIDKILDNK